MNEIRAGVIGLGFIGQTHIRAYNTAHDSGLPVKLAGVADKNADLLTGTFETQGNIDSTTHDALFDPEQTCTTTDPTTLIESDDIDLISICTHTDTHIELALQALRAGKHVLVEKPVARTSSDISILTSAAAEAEKQRVLCMPAMCMRFWPAWAWLRDAVTTGIYGRTRSATFQRLGSTPGWSDGFYKDKSRSGGALLDLHIHDTDFVHACFGVPDSVTSTGDEDHISTQYTYNDTPVHVAAEGCWDRHPSAPFVMRYSVCFERATAEFSLGADHELVLHDDSGSTPINLSRLTGWDMQIRAYLIAIGEGASTPPVTMHDALRVMQTIEAEQRSLAMGGSRRLER
ncbi:MAG: gfo/Idh/MocA family oxidoreductase [Phycisphaera sp.]|nr:MAG: gfo/Idh/MocA family oxidoreductase [Phycisphaera sp.]